MHSLAQRLLSHIRQQELLKAGDRVGVAVSGGIDSVALLRLLLEVRGELGIVLSVVHFNHKLRGAESDEDERFVEELARSHDLEFYFDNDDVAGQACAEGVSVETAARELRYGFFRSLIEDGPQGLTPGFIDSPERGPKGPLFHDGPEASSGTAESAPDIAQAPQGQNVKARHDSAGEEGAPDEESRQGRHISIPTLSQKTREGWGNPSLNKITTGHTLDDQAETVLMRLIRGAGLKGLGGIYPRIAVEDEDGELCGEIIRPLLATRRRELDQYLREIGQPWREDATNLDVKFTRNRVRKLLVPLIEKEFNPAVAENLAELADIARGEEDYWENEIAGWMGTAVHWSEPEWARLSQAKTLVQITPTGSPLHDGPQRLKPSTLLPPSGTAESVSFPNSPIDFGLQSRIDKAPWLVMNASVDRLWFLSEPPALQRRLVKAIGEHAGIPLEFKHVQEILQFAAETVASGKELALPLGWKVVWEPEQFVFLTPDLREPQGPQDYEYEIKIPGQVLVPEIGSKFETQLISAAESSGYNSEQLLDADSVRGLVKLRNWRPGDRFWPAHTKSPKKIKELLQERHVPQPERRLWPVVVNGDEIVWMRGYPVPTKLRAKAGYEALLIHELPLPQGTSE